MGKYIPPEEMTIEQLRCELKKTFAEWTRLRDEGGSDPSYPDGVNMNLVRNHIIWWKSFIADKDAEQLSLFGSGEIEDMPLPPIVPDNYVSPNSPTKDRFNGSPFWPTIVYEI